MNNIDTTHINVPYIDYSKLLSNVHDYIVSIDFSTWSNKLPYFNFLSTILTLILSIGIFYSLLKLNRIRHKESAVYNAKMPEAYTDPTKNTVINKKWERVLAHIESPSANDWKVAIIEADILLGELLDAMGYQGESIGEKLKRVAKGDMATLDQAWEAHKVRNAIAHQGADFIMSEHDAKKTIGLYQAVISEFQAKSA